MSQAAVRMSVEAFFDWLATQEGRHELVDGVPIAMAGADRRHDQVVVNVLFSLTSQLRRTRCRPFTADLAVRIPNGNIRYPDAGVQCGPIGLDDPRDRSADEPKLVVEVLSRSTKAFDQVAKLDEYRRVPTLDHVLLVDPETPDVIAWSRSEAGEWVQARHQDLDAVIEAPGVGVRLPLADIYDGVELRPRPRLTVTQEPG